MYKRQPQPFLPLQQILPAGSTHNAEEENWTQFLSPVIVRRSARINNNEDHPEGSGSFFTPVVFSSANKSLCRKMSRCMGVNLRESHYISMHDLELERINGAK